MCCFFSGVLWATGAQDQAKSKPVTSLLCLRWLMHSHFPVSVLNIMNTEKSECLERQGNMTAHKNENKDRNCFSHPGQSNCMTSYCRIMFSSIFGCDRNGKNTYFLKKTAISLKQFLLVYVLVLGLIKFADLCRNVHSTYFNVMSLWLWSSCPSSGGVQEIIFLLLGNYKVIKVP